jgi:hypothetical protein
MSGETRRALPGRDQTAAALSEASVSLTANGSGTEPERSLDYVAAHPDERDAEKSERHFVRDDELERGAAETVKTRTLEPPKGTAPGSLDSAAMYTC